METEIMTLREAAEYLRLSEKAVSRMAQEGRIPAQKLARQWRFQRSSIASWMADRNAVPADEQQLPPVLFADAIERDHFKQSMRLGAVEADVVERRGIVERLEMRKDVGVRQGRPNVGLDVLE